jgi:hypothetical protein
MEVPEIDPDERRALQDFEETFRAEFKGKLGQMDDLPYDPRVEAWGKLQEEYRHYQKAVAEREGSEPDFYDPALREKHKDLNKSLHLTADQTIKNALETQRAKDLAEQVKSRGLGAGHDRDRER